MEKEEEEEEKEQYYLTARIMIGGGESCMSLQGGFDTPDEVISKANQLLEGDHLGCPELSKPVQISMIKGVIAPLEITKTASIKKENAP
ncbi:hypothetical protein KAS79_00555 [Candidatus Parcubacteria bacterium]|nr:hypothetical protein [Candidatus Parcubacteria bacterium]